MGWDNYRLWVGIIIDYMASTKSASKLNTNLELLFKYNVIYYTNSIMFYLMQVVYVDRQEDQGSKSAWGQSILLWNGWRR